MKEVQKKHAQNPQEGAQVYFFTNLTKAQLHPCHETYDKFSVSESAKMYVLDQVNADKYMLDRSILHWTLSGLTIQ